MAESSDSRTLRLRQVYPHDRSKGNTSIDVIAIHGLDTGSPQTWVAYDTEDASRRNRREVHWLRDNDMLPAVLPEARIFTYDWNANYHTNAPVETLLGQAENLLSLLSYDRKSDGSTGRPLIFIGSCFGGLVLAEALNRAAQSESLYRELLLMTVGVIFLATPLRGSRAANAAHWRIYVGGIMGKQTSDTLVRDLDGKSGVLERLVQLFAENAQASWLQLPTHCFYETKRSEILNSVLRRSLARRLSTKYTWVSPSFAYHLALHISTTSNLTHFATQSRPT